MSTNEFTVGDTVSVTGVVDHCENGDVVVEIGDTYQSFQAKHVTFVSRPEKTYTVELTAYEIEQLQTGCYSSADEKLNKLVEDNNL